MARRKRFAPAGVVQHVYNRGSRRGQLFECDDDYILFIRLLEEARTVRPMRIVSYNAMPNHWHLLLWPENEGDLSRFMHWFAGTHGHYWRYESATVGEGAVYQSRFSAVPIEDSWHFLIARRYIERNALAASLCDRAEAWPWSSAAIGVADNQRLLVDQPPFPLPADWLEILNGDLQWKTEPDTGEVWDGDEDPDGV